MLAFAITRNFLFDVLRVNNYDMQGTYTYGDALLVQKSFYDLQPRDIVWLKYPLTDSVNMSTQFAQRLVAMPGDSLLIRDKIIHLNGKVIEDPAEVRHNYFIKMICAPDSAFLSQCGMNEGGKVSDGFDYAYSLTREQALFLRTQPYVSAVELRMEKKGTADEDCFPYNGQYQWNADQYGPLYIPKAGDTLQLDTTNVKLYQLLIREHEKNQLVIKHDSIFINGSHCTRYAVRKNYYFVMGDNRDNAVDSRHWGFVPENMITGKVRGTVRKKE